ncbi:MAG: nucleotidyltransferase family protein [Dehalococcoidia bacterium]|nr:MAG: nucleotidyltransferase family protein [Dehalococcoidia bacterium]
MVLTEILLSKQAYSNLISLPTNRRILVSKTLHHLRKNPNTGLKLWGASNLFLYQTATDIKIIYRLCRRKVQVLAIKVASEYPPSSKAKISAVILAAGKTDYGDSLPISQIATSFLDAGIDDLIVVLGYQAEQLKGDLIGKNLKIIVNPDYEHGLSKSLRCGLKIVSRDATAVLLTPGNRPLIKPEVVKQLIRTYKGKEAPIIVPTFSRVRGHPVMFDKLLIPELLKAKGDIGGREVLQQHFQELKQVEMEATCTLSN